MRQSIQRLKKQYLTKDVMIKMNHRLLTNHMQWIGKVHSETTPSQWYPNTMNISRRHISRVCRCRMFVVSNTGLWRIVVENECNDENMDVAQGRLLSVNFNSRILRLTLWVTWSCPGYWRSWQRRATWKFELTMSSEWTASPKCIVIGDEKGEFLSSTKTRTICFSYAMWFLCKKHNLIHWNKLDIAW